MQHERASAPAPPRDRSGRRGGAPEPFVGSSGLHRQQGPSRERGGHEPDVRLARNATLSLSARVLSSWTSTRYGRATSSDASSVGETQSVWRDRSEFANVIRG